MPTNTTAIQNADDFANRVRRFDELKAELEKMGIWDKVNELLELKSQMQAVFEKPKRIRRTKAQMSESQKLKSAPQKNSKKGNKKDNPQD